MMQIKNIKEYNQMAKLGRKPIPIDEKIIKTPISFYMDKEDIKKINKLFEKALKLKLASKTDIAKELLLNGVDDILETFNHMKKQNLTTNDMFELQKKDQTESSRNQGFMEFNEKPTVDKEPIAIYFLEDELEKVNSIFFDKELKNINEKTKIATEGRYIIHSQLKKLIELEKNDPIAAKKYKLNCLL